MFGELNVKEFNVGTNLKVGSNVRITGSDGGSAKYVAIGDNCFLGDNVNIRANYVIIGDYAKIQHNTTIHGRGDCRIGHNFWCGQYSILDCQGGLTIGNNVGVGAHSQLWSHIRYGDTLEGCRWDSTKPLWIGNDAWFVGHCIVGPVTVENKAMAMVGSVITKDMEANTIYGGSPAKAIPKMGPQFYDVTVDEKYDKMMRYWKECGSPASIKIVKSSQNVMFDDGISYYDVDSRKYTKNGSDEEIAFMNFLLPTRAKFTPYESYKEQSL